MPSVTDEPRSSEGPATAAPLADALRALPSDPVAPSARRLLEPLVGLDPGSVRVHRGEQATRLADRLDADGVALGDDIVIGAGYDDEQSPATVALLAHELTHAARSRDHRFVPPVARAARAAGGHGAQTRVVSSGSPAAASTRQPTPTPEIVSPRDDEEQLASHVEEEVRLAVAHEQARSVSSMPNAAADADSDVLRDDEREVSSTAERAPGTMDRSPGAERRQGQRSRWGGLPAPWEPLPASVIAHQHSSAADRSTATTVVAPSPASAASNGADSSGTAHLAARGRNVGGEEPAHAEPPADGDPGAANLDALARKVYDVLKRRLAAERRRGA